MKKIAFLINSLRIGGAEKVVATILTELYQQNYPVELLCIEKNDFYILPDGLKVIYLTNFTGKECGLKKFLHLPIIAWKLKKYIKQNNISIVNSHVYRANYINILAKIFGSDHTVQIVNHGIISFYKKRGFLGRINLFLIKYLYKKADLIVLISKVMQYDMHQLFNLKNEQVVINNPFNIKDIQQKSLDYVDDFSFNSEKSYIVSVGRLISAKRIQDLLHAISKLTNVELLLLGDGADKENLIRFAEQLGIYDRVHFLGCVTNPFKYILNTNLLVVTSENESFSNVIVESMACNVPVISSDCFGPREILAPDTDTSFQLKNSIEYAQYGILVPVAKPELLAGAIQKLLNDASLHTHYRNQGIRRARDFDVSIAIDKYKKILTL